MLTMHLWLSLLLVLWLWVLWSRRKMYKLMLKLPGPMGWPLLGMFPRIMGKDAILTIIGAEIASWGATFLSWFGPMPVLIVSDPQIAEEVIMSPHAKRKSTMLYAPLRGTITSGLVFINDPMASKHRRIFNPAFAHNVLVSFLPIFNEETDTLLRELDTLVGKGEQNLLVTLKNLNLRIAMRTQMGSDIRNEDVYQGNKLIKSYQHILDIGISIILSPWLNSKLMRHLFGIEKSLGQAQSNIKSLIRKMIDRGQQADGCNICLKLALDQLKNGVLSCKNVDDECHTIIIAAFETTAVTLSTILMLLALFPDCQQRAFEEIQSIFPQAGDLDVSYEDVPRLKYLDMVINESMRLLPSFPLIGREVTADFQLSNGAVLPRGLQVLVSILHLHRNKQIWGPQADLFNPEHFAPGQLHEKHPCAFIPFSKGKRNCAGAKYALISLKISLAKILRNFRLKSSFQFDDLVFKNAISLDFKRVPCVQVERRT